jgi:hypothetical protein
MRFSANRLAAVLGIMLGVLCGIGGYAFIYAKGNSYLLNDPVACSNCQPLPFWSNRAARRRVEDRFRVTYVKL